MNLSPVFLQGLRYKVELHQLTIQCQAQIKKKLSFYFVAATAFAMEPSYGFEWQQYNNHTQELSAKNIKEDGNLSLEDYVGELVTIPAGSFLMGCSYGDNACDDDENPQHSVTIDNFKLMSTEVTFGMWDVCVIEGGCTHLPDDEGWGRGNRPVVNVSYEDITQQFIPWLNQTTGQRFRLPTQAEWEYAARAGSTTKYSWGNSIGSGLANCSGCGSSWDDSQTAPVKSFSANAFGLYDMPGNVWEWVADCWNGNYQGAPSNGGAWLSGDCAQRVLRGGSWSHYPRTVRVSDRFWDPASDRLYVNGLRLAQDL